ncbi:hypothetical protein [Curvivirga aplysinae]|uniref:hypothetical protein n=1 Tax=Curvivirga aplysinae TaxID=2529852 RepID=UPI0012BB7A05|nr:hypothetical protein [Curvivirga aplysinae]MTI10175.1 hypothetical protein [Curvivirga aplysinae]
MKRRTYSVKRWSPKSVTDTADETTKKQNNSAEIFRVCGYIVLGAGAVLIAILTNVPAVGKEHNLLIVYNKWLEGSLLLIYSAPIAAFITSSICLYDSYPRVQEFMNYIRYIIFSVFLGFAFLTMDWVFSHVPTNLLFQKQITALEQELSESQD